MSIGNGNLTPAEETGTHRMFQLCNTPCGLVTAGKPKICGSNLDDISGWGLQGLIAPSVACGWAGLNRIMGFAKLRGGVY